MVNCIIHIGAPRVGTTVIQKYFLPQSITKIVFSKRPFKASAILTNKKKSIARWSPRKILEFIEECKIKENFDKYRFAEEVLFPVCSCMAHNHNTSDVPEVWEPIIKKAIDFLESLSTKRQMDLLISSERLCDTAASFIGNSKHSNYSWTFPVKPLCDYIKSSKSTKALILVGLRDPIQYLRSKYLRTVIQRQLMNEKFITPGEYIKRQSILEKEFPGTSALAPAIHAEFLKQLQKVAFVKAYGFKELIMSKDFYKLVGIMNEKQLSFSKFPIENKLPFTKQQELEVEEEIIISLKSNKMHNQVLNSKMYE